MSGREELDSALKAIMAAKREELGEPPTPEELLAWRDGGLDPAARRSVEARLAVHPDAARALADLAAFPEVEPAPGTPELSDDDIEARWQSLRKRMEESPSPLAPSSTGLPTAPTLTGSEGTGRGWRWPHTFFQLAAVALVALGIGFVGGRGSRPELPVVAVNAAIAELTPAEEGGTRSVADIEVPDAAEAVVLVLGLADVRELPDYEAEILDAEGDRVWSRGGLRPTRLGTFHLAFRRNALPPGTYQIHLFGREAERRMLLATYDLRLAGG